MRTLGPGGFDPRNDILGLMVNRCCHVFSSTYSSLYDPMDWMFTETPERSCVSARQPFGRISVANSDAAASPHTDAAFLTAHWAVEQALGTDLSQEGERYRHRAVISALLEPWFARRTLAESGAALSARRLLYAPYRTFPELAADPAAPLAGPRRRSSRPRSS